MALILKLLFKEGHLNNFFRKINYKKGRATAVSTLARKLVVIIWNILSRHYGMTTKGISYNQPTQHLCLDQKRKLGLVSQIKIHIAKFDISNAELGIVSL